MREDHAAPRAAGGILRARAHGGSTQSLGIACEGGASDLIDFSVNVNPAGPSPRAVVAACKALSRIDAYPDRESLALVRALARAQGIPEDTIVCGAGASDIIWRLAAAVRPKRIVVCAPTFSEYAEAASYYGACVQEFPLSEADDFDVPASFARAIEGPGDVAYLCNPNNPTGRLVDPRVIDAAACRCDCSSWTSASSDLRPTPAKGAWPHAPRVRAMWPCSPRLPSSTEWRGCGWDI